MRPRARCVQASQGAFTDHITLELGQGSHHIEHAEKFWAIKLFARHFVGKGSCTLLLPHGIFLERGGLFVSAGTNVAQFHLRSPLAMSC